MNDSCAGYRLQEVEHPGSVWHEGRCVLKGLGSELRILSSSFKDAICSSLPLKPSEKGKTLPSLQVLDFCATQGYEDLYSDASWKILVMLFTATCPQPWKTCGPSDHQVRASLVQERGCGLQKHPN